MFVFFKQKTAYEMRISDWSSDVCSSDLAPHGAAVYTGRNVCTQRLGQFGQPLQRIIQAPEAVEQPECCRRIRRSAADPACDRQVFRQRQSGARSDAGACRKPRSEEHTSELQSLMRISYAVFCLKKQKNRICKECKIKCDREQS